MAPGHAANVRREAHRTAPEAGALPKKPTASFRLGERIPRTNSRIEPVNQPENMETGKMPVLRFMESLDIQNWMHLEAMNRV